MSASVDGSSLLNSLDLAGLPQNKKLDTRQLNYLKNVGISLGVGVFGGLAGDQIASLAGKIGIIPDLDWSQMMIQMCVNVAEIDNFYLRVLVLAPTAEEVVFRYGIQDILLKKLPKKIINAIAPNKTNVLDSTIAKVNRIALAAGLFAAAHCVNYGFYPDAYIIPQVVGSFVAGVAFGVLKESKCGIVGAMTAHFACNLLASLDLPKYC